MPQSALIQLDCNQTAISQAQENVQCFFFFFFLCMQLDIIEVTHSHGMPKVLWNNEIANVIGKIWVILLIICLKSDIDGSYELNSSFLLGLVRLVQACPKCLEK